MTVSAINCRNGSSSTATTAQAARKARPASTTRSTTIQFLQLLVAQLKNQDPTNPSDPTQFVSQLASFSAVEQQLNTNSKLDSLLTQSAISQAGSLIGKTVTSADGSTSGQVAIGRDYLVRPPGDIDERPVDQLEQRHHDFLVLPEGG